MGSGNVERNGRSRRRTPRVRVVLADSGWQDAVACALQRLRERGGGGTDAGTQAAEKFGAVVGRVGRGVGGGVEELPQVAGGRVAGFGGEPQVKLPPCTGQAGPRALVERAGDRTGGKLPRVHPTEGADGGEDGQPDFKVEEVRGNAEIVGEERSSGSKALVGKSMQQLGQGKGKMLGEFGAWQDQPDNGGALVTLLRDVRLRGHGEIVCLRSAGWGGISGEGA